MDIEETGEVKTKDQDFDDAFMASYNEIVSKENVETEDEEPVEDQQAEDETSGEESVEAQGIDAEPELEESDEQGAEADIDDMPSSWSKEDEKAWKSASPEIKEIAKRREQQLQKLINQKESKLTEAATKYNEAAAPLQNVLRELEPMAKSWRLGKNPVTLEQGILRAVSLEQHIKETDKLQLAKEFLRASGHGPEALIESEQEKENSELVTLRKEMELIKQNQEQKEESQYQAQVDAYKQTLDTAYTKFATTKNAQGEPKYPQAQNDVFARSMGSLVHQLAERFPGSHPDKLVQEAYKRMGGQISNGVVSRSATQNTEKLRRAATTSYGKGRPAEAKRQVFDNVDDAWAATFEEFGLND
jgi:prophage DNA circulation protein